MQMDHGYMVVKGFVTIYVVFVENKAKSERHQKIDDSPGSETLDIATTLRESIEALGCSYSSSMSSKTPITVQTNHPTPHNMLTVINDINFKPLRFT
jgi:hypothetical protein